MLVGAAAIDGSLPCADDHHVRLPSEVQSNVVMERLDFVGRTAAYERQKRQVLLASGKESL